MCDNSDRKSHIAERMLTDVCNILYFTILQFRDVTRLRFAKVAISDDAKVVICDIAKKITDHIIADS